MRSQCTHGCEVVCIHLPVCSKRCCPIRPVIPSVFIPIAMIQGFITYIIDKPYIESFTREQRRIEEFAEVSFRKPLWPSHAIGIRRRMTAPVDGAGFAICRDLFPGSSTQPPILFIYLVIFVHINICFL